MLKQAVGALPRAEHVAVMWKFAQLEFSEAGGSAERGRTIFEGIVANYPKRVDVWSVYIDQEVKLSFGADAAADEAGGRAQGAKAVRRLMDRATSMNLSTKKMKFLFKKYLEFEQEHGDSETQETVREKARDYIRKKASGSSE